VPTWHKQARSHRQTLAETTVDCPDKAQRICQHRRVVRLALDHCVIAVSDWTRSNIFYRDVLGAEIDQKDDWFGHYRFDGWQLNVHGPGFQGLNALKPVEPGNSDLCFVWPGPIEQAVEHLRVHEIEIVAGPIDGDSAAGGRGRHLYFRDPDGSLLEFVSYQDW
jgi:catechol 2,3-dioxygenase-like lactoylglutathione lyase family enzyme